LELVTEVLWCWDGEVVVVLAFGDGVCVVLFAVGVVVLEVCMACNSFLGGGLVRVAFVHFCLLKVTLAVLLQVNIFSSPSKLC
jgi:hypothetical protein